MKELVRERFSKNTATYDEYALAQKQGALLLKEELINDRITEENIGKIAEFGCGTGILSTYIDDLFTKSAIYFSDLSPEMVLECKKKFGDKKNRYFFAVNGEDLPCSGLKIMKKPWKIIFSLSKAEGHSILRFRARDLSRNGNKVQGRLVFLLLEILCLTRQKQKM
jgi:SAM-dependent methyltransferase